MNYISVNKTDDFEFHDAYFKYIGVENNDLVVSASFLNIHKSAEQNPFNEDAQIKEAKITFKGFRMVSFKGSVKYEQDESGTWKPAEEPVVLESKEAEETFLQELNHGITVYDFGIYEDGLYYVDGFGEDPYFTAFFNCDTIIVEWDEYLKKAWYELHKQYKYKITVATPDGDINTDLHIIRHDEDVYYQGKLEKAPVVTAGVKYNGKEIWGRGKDCLWVDAIADLQKKLPDDVTLKCCLTCRFGNMCPYGNKEGEVFCTKDLQISSKNDMCDLFSEEKERETEKRSRNYTDCCADFCPQSEDYYTYNDYLYQLNK